jgi:hypothetical protein
MTERSEGMARRTGLEPRRLFEGPYVYDGGVSFDVVPDERRFLLLDAVEQQNSVTHLNVGLKLVRRREAEDRPIGASMISRRPAGPAVAGVTTMLRSAATVRRSTSAVTLVTGPLEPSRGDVDDARAAGTLGLLLTCAVVLGPTQRAQLSIEAFRTQIRKILADGATPSLYGRRVRMEGARASPGR